MWISEQTAIISIYNINWLVFITETECVYCAVRTGSLYTILRSAHTVYLCVLCGSQNKQRLFPYTALTDWILGAFEKLRKATISFVMSVCLSVRVDQLGSHRKNFHVILYLKIFRNTVNKLKIHSDFIKRNFTWRPLRNFYHNLARFFLEWKTFQTNVVEEIKKQILFSITFFRKLCLLWYNAGKYCRAGQATDDNMAHAHCMLDT